MRWPPRSSTGRSSWAMTCTGWRFTPACARSRPADPVCRDGDHVPDAARVHPRSPGPIRRRRRARHRQIQGPPTALAPRSVPLSGEPTGRACHTVELVVGERASAGDHHDVLHPEIASARIFRAASSDLSPACSAVVTVRSICSGGLPTSAQCRSSTVELPADRRATVGHVEQVTRVAVLGDQSQRAPFAGAADQHRPAPCRAEGCRPDDRAADTHRGKGFRRRTTSGGPAQAARPSGRTARRYRARNKPMACASSAL